MAYKKTLIRQHFTELLKVGVTSVSERVYSGRINPKEDENYPYLTVFTKDENVIEQYTTSTKRELSLHVGIVVKNNDIASGDFYEVAENIMFDVEEVMSRIITVQSKNPAEDFYALLDDIVLVGSTTDHNNDSGSDIGSAMLTYKIEYEYALPIVSLALEDFDIEASIAHIQIINPGVPENV
ncbi:MAG: hypothetical protein ACTSP9_13215 [Promethearchaeota archaeon]